MKRIFICILIFILILSCSACKKDEQQISTENNQPITVTPDEDSVGNVIPEGALYYQGNSWSFAQKIIDFNLGTKLEAGSAIPDAQTGDILLHNNVLYVYNAHLTSPISGFIGDDKLNGWGAAYALDTVEKNVTILNSINNKPVVSVAHFFRGQKILGDFKSITIPSNVKNITGLFDSSLAEVPVTLILNGTPESYSNCLGFSGTPVIEDGKILFTTDGEVHVEGNCSQEIKTKITEEKTQGLKTYIK